MSSDLLLNCLQCTVLFDYSVYPMQFVENLPKTHSKKTMHCFLRFVASFFAKKMPSTSQPDSSRLAADSGEWLHTLKSDIYPFTDTLSRCH